MSATASTRQTDHPHGLLPPAAPRHPRIAAVALVAGLLAAASLTPGPAVEKAPFGQGPHAAGGRVAQQAR